MTLDINHHLDLKNGQFAGTSASDLAQLFHSLAADPDKDRLVVHFHGGLVSLPPDAPERDESFVAEAFGNNPALANELAALLACPTASPMTPCRPSPSEPP
jgi:hypothetical protein